MWLQRRALASESFRTPLALLGGQTAAVNGSKGYYLVPVTEKLKAALKKGLNTIAVHAHEGGQGQWVDLGLLIE